MSTTTDDIESALDNVLTELSETYDEVEVIDGVDA